MIDERTRQLLNADIDDELDAAGRAELDALLRQHPQLAQEAAQLRRLHACLGAVEALDPPPELARRILRQSNLPSRSSLWQSIAGFMRSPLTVPAVAFAAGLLVAVGLYRALPEDLSGLATEQQMTGSMLPATSLASLVLDEAALRGTVSLTETSPDLRVLRFDLASAGAVDITLDLGDTGLAFETLSQSEAGVRLLDRDAGILRISSLGNQRFSLSLRNGAVPEGAQARLRVEFMAGGKPVYQGALDVN